MTRWYRAYEGTVTDAKLAEAALVVGCSRSVVIATWHAILENAASMNDGGRIDVPSRRIAAILCEPLETIETLMAALETVGLVQDSVVTAWNRHDPAAMRLPWSEWATIRLYIFMRDKFTCRYCGAHGVALECDHVVPLSRGGSNDKRNLITACKPCNRKKADRTIEELGWKLCEHSA